MGSEEQQLQAAIRESMTQTKTDHVEVSLEQELLSFQVPEEPNNDEASAMVQIRMPDGSRVVRKFPTQYTVKSIFAFVAQSNDDTKNGRKFELRSGYPPRDLFPIIEETIQNCSLNGESITVRWKS